VLIGCVVRGSIPPIAERFQVTGLVYDVETGRVERAA
jgi:hypothetical protein